MKTLKIITLAFCLLIQGIAFSQDNKLQVIKEKYDATLKERNKGVAILVKKDNRTHTASIGNFNLTAHSVFNIGSATKTFTAILLMQEVEKGTIKLTDSIGTYLTPIKNVDGSLSIQALMTHESGIAEVIGRNIEETFYAKSDSLYTVQLLNHVSENDPEMVGKYDYCNTNYFLLGKIIEKITDQSYFDLLRERIFIPLKMDKTYPYVYKNISNLATPYHEEKDVTEYLDYRYFANIAYAAGSIASTLTDMEKFYTALFETDILLQKETVKTMMNAGNEFYGLGIMKSESDGVKYYGHGGNNIGYAFRNSYDPISKDLFLIFSNTKNIPLKATLKKDVFSVLTSKEINKALGGISAKNMKRFAGKYLLKEANLTFEIIKEGNKLFLSVEAQGIKSLLTQTNETTLTDSTVGATIEYLEGEEDLLKFSQNGYETKLHRINADEPSK